MKLIARKPCSFGGEKFYIGDEIPAELVLNPKEQEKMGVLIVATDTNDGHKEPEPPAPAPVSTITVNIHAEEGDLPLELTPAGIQAVFDVLTGKPEEAENVINQMEDGDALILLHISSTRKAVKAAAEARAQALSAAQEGAESEGEQ